MNWEGEARQNLLRFLLGELPAEEVDAIDQRLLIDEEFANLVAEARNDLLDAYAAGELDTSMRQRVEKALLQGPTDSLSLSVARKLQSTRTAGQESTRRSKVKWPIARKRVWIPVAVAAVVVLVVGSVLFYRPKQSATSTSITGLQRKQETPKAGRAAPPFVLLLTPEITRGAGSPRTVTLPPQAVALKVQIVLEAHQPPGPYQVILKSGQKHKITAFDHLQPQRLGSTRFLQVTFPVRLVPPGDYQFFIYLEHPPEKLIHSYAVRIAPKQPQK